MRAVISGTYKKLYRNIFGKDRKFYGNLFSLGLVQATNFIIPLITLPYLIRTIGLEQFGIVSYALTIMTYAAIVIDYGFMMSATRQVSLYRDDLNKLSNLFSAVTVARLLLFVIVMLSIILLTTLFDHFKSNKLLYLYGLIFPLGIALMPTWFYQGLEQMRQITYLNITGKLITVGLLFSSILRPKDYIYVLAIYGISNAISGVYGLFKAVYKYKIKFKVPKIQTLTEQYSIGFNLFLTSVTVALVNNVNLLVLGGFVDNNSLGNYGLSEKIIFAVWQVLAVFSTAMYPVLCRLAQESHDALRYFLKRAFVPFTICVILGCLGVFVFAEQIIIFIAKTINSEAITILRIMIFVPVIVCLNIPAYQTQLAYAITNESTKLYGFAALLNVVLCVVLSSLWGAIGAALSMVVIQSIITFGLYLIIQLKYKQYSLF